MSREITFTGDIEHLLSEAPKAVDSFYPGHWRLMCDLEDEATKLLLSNDIDAAIPFFANVAFLKQPYRIDKNHLIILLQKVKDDILNAIIALSKIDQIDYEALESVARLPYFGKRGGRAFASAVVRLFRPDKFAIIDWRNLAVLSNAESFSGLINPPVLFNNLSPQEILTLRGYIPFDKDLYVAYNETIRKLSKKYANLTPAKVDLILWTFSIQRKPFMVYDPTTSIFEKIISKIPPLEFRSKLKGTNRNNFINQIVHEYLLSLSTMGYLSPLRIRQELSSIFKLIMVECIRFGKNKRRIETTIIRVVNALNSAIQNPSLSTWNRWEDWVNPSSSEWKGINLPAGMLLEGYIILEDFIPIRKYLEQRYCEDSFEIK